jgi:hypothetical protein
MPYRRLMFGFHGKGNKSKLAAGISRAATRAPAGAFFQTGRNIKSIPGEINGNRFGFLEQVFVDDEFVGINIKNRIQVIWFIQNQCKRGSASAALV